MESSRYKTPRNLENGNTVTKTTLHENVPNNYILPQLEKYGFVTPDKKAKELIKELTETQYLYALKSLFENPLNKFSSQILRDSLVALADPKPFDYYSRESMARLELHLRTWVTVLERICFSPMRLSRELRERVYDSLTKFAEIHRRTTQVIEDGLENNFKPKSYEQQKNEENDNLIKKRNYNIDFLLIHLRDTLHSLRDDETWFQELIRRVKDILKGVLGVAPGIVSKFAGIPCPNDNNTLLSMIVQLRQGLTFKYPIARYYFDWRTLLIIQHNIIEWTESSEKIISKKFGEMIFMEYL